MVAHAKVAHNTSLQMQTVVGAADALSAGGNNAVVHDMKTLIAWLGRCIAMC